LNQQAPPYSADPQIAREIADSVARIEKILLSIDQKTGNYDKLKSTEE
jgi:hypothetical protein